jgi:hypothetical protein
MKTFCFSITTITGNCIRFTSNEQLYKKLVDWFTNPKTPMNQGITIEADRDYTFLKSGIDYIRTES